MGTVLKFPFEEEVAMNQGTILGSQLSKWITLAVLVAVLAALFTASVVRAQEDSTTIEYAENGTGPVATFTATDPEGAMPITWSLATAAQVSAVTDLVGADNADLQDFVIDDETGVLKFDIAEANDGSSPGSPDFEDPQGSVGSPANTYKVVVAACDVTADDCTDGEAGYHKVTVKVTDVAETGKVTWTVNPNGTSSEPNANILDTDNTPIMQFQVDAILIVATLGGVTDGDVSGPTKDVNERLQWYRSPSKTAMGTAIDNETSDTYIVTTEDVDMYLRVSAFYNVDTGREESASLTSDYPVLGSRSNNVAPEFSSTTVTREVSEGDKGMTVGAPVKATDDITNALNYTLAGVDRGRFKIDPKTGQITTNVDLNYDETTPGNDGGTESQCVTRNSCVVTVRATDSAGAATSGTDDATVTIKLKNVDDKPMFDSGFKMRDVAEGMTQVDDDADATNTPTGEAIYLAMDPDGLEVNLSLMGDDGAKFQLSVAQALSFKEKPDYEKPTDKNKDNVYEVTVRASDGTMYADRMVKVTVTNVDEGPTVMGKDSVNYAENGKDAVATFTATDPEGVTPIFWSKATDAQVDNEADLVDADNFDAVDFMIDDEDGVLKFNITPADDGSSPGSPDFENGQGTGTGSNTYSVVVVACDVALDTNDVCPDTGKAGYHKVTVKVTDVAETGKVTWTVNPNGTDSDPNADILDTDNTPIMQFQVDAILTASATDGDIAEEVKDVSGNHNLRWRWSSGGREIANETSDTYTVTTEDGGKRIRVTAFYNVGTGSTEESASLTSDYPVLGSRSNNVAPEFSSTTVTREVSEGDKGMAVGAPVKATDDITNALNYTLAGVDRGRFKIDPKTGQITTNVDLNYDETTPGNDGGTESQCVTRNSCVVTVRATDSAGAATSGPDDATVTIKLKNVDDKPMFDSGLKMVSVAEGSKEVRSEGAANPYVATDPDGLRVNLTLMGADGAKFQLLTGGMSPSRRRPTTRCQRMRTRTTCTT